MVDFGVSFMWPPMIDLNALCPSPTHGLLFVGDPHVWSLKPGRRRDDYFATICDKLEQIAHISNDRNLWVVCLGDLFHQAQDNNLDMISRLTRVFSLYKRKPIVLVGNHDLTETTLTPGTTLDVFHASGQILAMVDNGPFATLNIDTPEGVHRLVLGGTPYGQDIPVSLAQWFKGTTHESIKKKAKADTIAWITHEDLAFDNSYPNAVALRPIVGVDIAVNGHMHRMQKPVKMGQTSWYNPGNIARISIDLADQVVAVWAWEPTKKTMPSSNDLDVVYLEQIPLKVQEGKVVLSLEGHIAKKEKVEHLVEATTTSRFVEQLKQDQHVERTDEGVVLRETLNEDYATHEVPEHISLITDELFKQALMQHQAKGSNV